MTGMDKFAGAKLECGNCRARLRLHGGATTLLLIVTFGVSVFALQRYGFESASVPLFLAIVAIWIPFGIIVPLELRDSHD